MKNSKIICWLLISPSLLFSQSTFQSKYVYQAPHYYESIDLFEDGNFVYYKRTEFIASEVKGNWQLRNDSILVLDSRPQKNKLIVFESHKKGKKMTFHVRNMHNSLVYYNLFLISNKFDTIELRQQFEKTIILGKFSSFYIIDTQGQCFPSYNIKGVKSNFFKVMIEEQRVFENEYWKFHEEYIVPLGIDRKYSNYKLIKN